MRRALLRRCSAAQWVETQVGDLRGLSVTGPSPGIVWAHGLGGSCDADAARGLTDILDPRVLGRSVLRLDLRGHGRSADAHNVAHGPSQYTWRELAKDMRVAARGSLSRAFFGGEAMGAAVALHAAVAATASGSVDAPPGIVLMRPPLALARAAAGGAMPDAWAARVADAASALEGEGVAGLEALEAQQEVSLIDGAAAVYSAEPLEDVLAELRARRRGMKAEAYAAALRGHASFHSLGQEVQSLGQSRQAMAGDAYGVPLELKCPVLLLAVPGDPDHPVEAAEELASCLPGTELVLADSLQEARARWAKSIDAFIRKAWMKEFLTKRVMPQ